MAATRASAKASPATGPRPARPAAPDRPVGGALRAIPGGAAGTAPTPPVGKGTRARPRRAASAAPRRFDVASDARLGLVVRDTEAVSADAAVPLVAQDPMQQIALVREGVPAALVGALADALALSKEKLYAGTGLKRATIDAKMRAGAYLAPDESERLLGLARLVGRVQVLWRESGDHELAPDFAPAVWLGRWLDDPNPALGGERPLALLDTATGREVVDRLLLAMQAGAYW